jgi:hypothetical protein
MSGCLENNGDIDVSSLICDIDVGQRAVEPNLMQYLTWSTPKN